MLHRNDFMSRYANYDNKEDTFVTPDHTKAELDRQYNLRQLRRRLSDENPDNEYQVRNGTLRMKPKSASTWTDIDTPAPEPSASASQPDSA